LRYIYNYIFIGVILLGSEISGIAQSLSCNQTVQISLQEHTCQARITADILLENPDDQIQYLIEIKKPNGTILNDNLVGIEEVDELLIVKISHPSNGNSCWANVTVENKIMPDIIGCREFKMPCSSYPDTLQYMEHMSYEYGCGPYNMRYQDSIVHFQCARDGLDQIVYRKWYISNTSFERYVCTQKMMFQRNTLENIFFPPNFDGHDHPAIVCDYQFINGAYTRYDSIEFLADGHPSVRPYPYGTGQPGGESCKHVNSTFQDTRFNSCGNNVKILRTWIVLDWCTGEQFIKNQTIQLKDAYGPLLKCSMEAIVVYAEFEGCVGSINNMEPSFEAWDCSDYTYNVSVKLKEQNIDSYDNAHLGNITLLENGNFSISELPQDTLWLIYTVTDDCGNVSQCHSEVIIKDKEAPIALCEESTVVTLGDHGQAPLYASGLDNYSYDNCGVSHYQIQRIGESCSIYSDKNEFSDYIEFCCEDVERSPIKIAIRTFDWSGNYSDCWMNVYVQDKNLPVINHCPQDMSITCDQDYEDMVLTGRPHINQLCGFRMEYEDDLTDMNECGIGILKRTWFVYNSYGDQVHCIQHIRINEKFPFTDRDIHWPENIELNECYASLDDLTITGEPWFNEFHCKNLIVDYEDEIFDNSANTCVKILRTWRVTDWCKFDYEQTGATYFWEHVQQIELIDRTRPKIISNCENIELQADVETCDAQVVILMEGEDECQGDDLIFEYEIDYDSDGEFQVDDIINSKILEQKFGIGTHKIRYKLSDRCGNFEKCEFFVTIHPSNDFQPICISELSLSLGETGVIEIWASDFIKDVSSSCGPATNVTFSFSDSKEEPILLVDCGDFADGDGIFMSREQTIYINDQFGNQSSCNVQLIVNDNFNKCSDGSGSSIIITGKVTTESKDGIQDVPISLFDMNSGEQETMSTFQDGSFIFNNLSVEHNYEISGDDFGSITDGLSSLDLVILQRHILGVEELRSPYTLLAADVDGSGQITINDLVSLRKVLLGLTDEFPVHNYWSIFNSDQNMLEGEVPLDVEDQVYIHNMSAGVTELNLMAVKIGDVNNSYVSEVKNKNLTQLGFKMNCRFDQWTGKQWIDLYPNEHILIDGYQLGFEIDNNEVEKIVGEDLVLNENYVIRDNQVQFAVAFNKPKPLNKDVPFISIALKHKQNSFNHVHLSKHKNFEIYLSRNGIRSGIIEFESIENHKKLEFTILPNPFDEELNFNFELEKNTEIEIALFNSKGELIHQNVSTLEEGKQTIRMKGSVIKGSGLFFYKIRSEEKIFSGKVIKM